MFGKLNVAYVESLRENFIFIHNYSLCILCAFEKECSIELIILVSIKIYLNLIHKQ